MSLWPHFLGPPCKQYILLKHDRLYLHEYKLLQHDARHANKMGTPGSGAAPPPLPEAVTTTVLLTKSDVVNYCRWQQQRQKLSWWKTWSTVEN